MNINKLKAKIVEQGLNVERLAEMASIERSAMYRKLKDLEKVRVGEAKRIAKALNMTDAEAIEIFLR